MDIKVNFDRLKKDIESLSQIGRDPQGGITRPSFSKADLEARDWLKGRIESSGLALGEDGAGNIFGRKEGKGKTIMAGSHIDTVINGGMFDGSIGVLSALECLRRIKEENIPHSKPLEVASFTDEEGNLSGDFLGSRAFTGLLDQEILEKGLTQFGVPLAEILEGTNFTIQSIMEAHEQRPDIEAFIEIHIEQGPVLETENKTIGIVDGIAGKHYRWCSFAGKASHAGTTPLELRQDAFLGLADFALKSTQHVATEHYGSMVTIGRVSVRPGAFSIVPGQVDFSFEFRSQSKKTLEELKKHLFSLAEDVASTRGLEFGSKLVDETEPVSIPARIQDIMKDECENLGYSSMTLPSGAGHDVQILASVAEPGMIFIPCVDGISHSPQEMIQWEDLEKGANLLLQVLIRLAS
ncbi:MAG: Zn-dependent hydrolase [Candidatus Aminicenantes bacterium]|nr:MAG: Zn-dependent hydrolase [Candidatus Aminicenantes bacterium]